MFDEPRRHPVFLLLLALAGLGTIPFLFIGRELVLWWGIPLWLWSSGFFTAVLAGLTCWGHLRLWRDDGDNGDDDGGGP